MTHTYPLQWPTGWPETPSYQRLEGGFQVSYEQAEKQLAEELERLGATSGHISTAQELRVSGTPRRDRQPSSPAVAVYFERNGKLLCIPCDRFTSTRANIRAVGLTVEGLRRMERYGTSQMVEAALSGFAALPAQATSSEHMAKAWYEVLEVSQSASPETIKAAYRSMMKRYHPDQGGSDAKFQEIQKAFQESGVA